jgi:hypothetical protein
MTSLLDSVASSFTPDLIGRLGTALGTDPQAVGKGLGAVAPLLLSGMSRMSASPAGAQGLLELLPKDSGMLGNLGNLIGGLFGGGSSQAGPTLTGALFGQGTGAIAGALSRALGFNVAPLLAMAAPVVMGALAGRVKASGLDASALAATLKDELGGFAGNAANRDTVALVEAAMSAGDRASRKIEGFGTDWTKVVAAPAAALAAITSADLSGPIDSMKEVRAATEAMARAAREAAPDSVLQAALGAGLTGEMIAKMRELAPRKDALIDVMRSGVAAVAANAPADVNAYRDALLSIARATAEASKDGGFLGFGGKLVSDDEQKMLDAIRTALR